jgi:hypothetical protein
VSASRRSRLSYWALAGGIIALGLAPLAPLVLLQPSTMVAINLTNGGDPGGTLQHPWFTVPVRWIMPILVGMMSFSAVSAALSLLAALLRREPRWAVYVGLLLSLVALAVWFLAWDQGFAWREFYRDLGVRE